MRAAYVYYATSGMIRTGDQYGYRKSSKIGKGNRDEKNDMEYHEHSGYSIMYTRMFV